MFTLSFAAAVTLVAAKTPSFNDSTYLALSASAKSDQIWDQISADTSSKGWPSIISQAGIFTETFAPSFEQVGDEMPKG